jgi:hypothetical protein
VTEQTAGYKTADAPLDQSSHRSLGGRISQYRMLLRAQRPSTERAAPHGRTPFVEALGHCHLARKQIDQPARSWRKSQSFRSEARNRQHLPT